MDIVTIKYSNTDRILFYLGNLSYEYSFTERGSKINKVIKYYLQIKYNIV